jgi:hypothetical protein
MTEPNPIDTRRPSPLEDPQPADDRPLTHTEYGGLLFLAHAVDPVLTDLVFDDLAAVLARLCHRLTGAPPTDPAVQALTGVDPHESLPEPDADLETLVEQRIRDWILARLKPEPPDEPADDLAWVWERVAEVEVTPGWVEGVSSLEDVDLRIRRAALDLDPGWLWWRGVVMRFRYV